MDVSSEHRARDLSRVQAEGLDHRERAGLKSITGSVQKKDIHIPWNQREVHPLEEDMDYPKVSKKRDSPLVELAIPKK